MIILTSLKLNSPRLTKLQLYRVRDRAEVSFINCNLPISSWLPIRGSIGDAEYELALEIKGEFEAQCRNQMVDLGKDIAKLRLDVAKRCDEVDSLSDILGQ